MFCAECRLAMLGFVAALGAELATGKTIFEQTEQAPTAIGITFAVFAIATLASNPLSRAFSVITED